MNPELFSSKQPQQKHDVSPTESTSHCTNTVLLIRGFCSPNGD